MQWSALALAASLSIFLASLFFGISYTAPSGAFHFEVWEGGVGFVTYPQDQQAARQRYMGSGWTPILAPGGIRWLPRSGAGLWLPLWMPVVLVAMFTGWRYARRRAKRRTRPPVI